MSMTQALGFLTDPALAQAVLPSPARAWIWHAVPAGLRHALPDRRE